MNQCLDLHTIERILNGSGMILGIIGTLIMYFASPRILIGAYVFGGDQKPKEDKATKKGRIGLLVLCLL